MAATTASWTVALRTNKKGLAFKLKPRPMKRFIALTMCVVSLTAVAQINYPYNPDEDASGQIENNDLLGFLTVYGSTFAPGEPTVNGCNYTGWAIKGGAPAVFLMNETLPEGYSYAANQICAANVVVSDSYCTDNSWDNVCQDDYEECIQQGGCEMTLSAYLSSLSIRVDSLEAAFEPMDDLIIPGSLTVNQNITVGGDFVFGSLSVGNFIDSTAIQFDSLETFMDSTHVRLDTLESRTPLQGKPGFDGNSSLWRGVAEGTTPNAGSFSWDENANALMVNSINQNNTDMTGWMSAIDAGDVLTIRKAKEPETEAFFQVVSAVALPTVQNWSINLDPLSSSQDFFPLDTADYFIGYSRRGETGPVGYPGEQGAPGMTSGLGFNWTYSGFFDPQAGSFTFNGQTLELDPTVYNEDGTPIDVSPVIGLIEVGDLLYIKSLSSQFEMAVLYVFDRSIDIFTGEPTFQTDVVFSSLPPSNGGGLGQVGEAYFIGIDKN